MFHFLQNVFRWTWTGIFVPLVDQARGNLSSVIGPRQTFGVGTLSAVACGVGAFLTVKSTDYVLLRR